MMHNGPWSSLRRTALLHTKTGTARVHGAVVVQAAGPLHGEVAGFLAALGATLHQDEVVALWRCPLGPSFGPDLVHHRHIGLAAADHHSCLRWLGGSPGQEASSTSAHGHCNPNFAHETPPLL